MTKRPTGGRATASHYIAPRSNSRPGGYPVLTAEEFIAQGTTAAQVASIAKWYRKNDNKDMANYLRPIADRVAALTGQILKTERLICRRPANDNRRHNGRAA